MGCNSGQKQCGLLQEICELEQNGIFDGDISRGNKGHNNGGKCSKNCEISGHTGEIILTL